MKFSTLGCWIACVAALSSCTSRDAAPPPGVSAIAPTVVSLSATEYAITAPDTIDAGWSTFRMANHGGEVHYGHIVQLDSGRTVPDLVAAYAEAIRTSGPRPKWVQRFGGPGGIGPGDSASVTQHLEPGHYVWICPVEDDTGAPHFGKGEFKAFVVRAPDPAVAQRAVAPTATRVVQLGDFSFAVDSPMVAGPHTIRVENVGVEPHDLVLMKLAPGMTINHVQATLNPERARRDAPAGEAPPSFESLGTLTGGIAAIGPGRQAFFDTDLAAGEYVLLCMATAPDGRSHIEHGMIQHFSVREP